jgi:hypothetical protein
MDPNEIEDVRAVMLRYVYAQATGNAKPGRAITCVHVERNEDPSVALVGRLSRYGFRVRRGSRCVIRDGVVVDAFSGEAGVSLALESLNVIGSGVATASGEYWVKPKAALRLSCSLEFRLGGWQVVRETLRSWS